MAGPGHGHIQGVEFFSLPLTPLGRQCVYRAGRWLALAGQKNKSNRGWRLARPVDQDAHGFGLAFW